MDDKVLITTFSYPTRMEIIRAKLEDEGIPCYTTDETNIAAHNLTDAMGGVKLFVDPENAERAGYFVQQAGYHIYTPVKRNWLEKLIYGIIEGDKSLHPTSKPETDTTPEKTAKPTEPKQTVKRGYIFPIIFGIIIVAILLLMIL